MNKITDAVMLTFRIMIILLLIYFINSKNQGAINVVLISFLISFFDIYVKKILKYQMNNILKISLIAFIYASQCLGTALNFYDMISWWDVMLHTISGIIFFYVGIYLWDVLTKKNTYPKANILIIVIFATLFSLSIITIWEIFEFSVDSILNENMQVARDAIGRDAIADTMLDMISAVIGTIVAILTICIFKKKSIIKNV